ncbi:hypothetical protein [Vulcanococcus limneticus]|uniref:hypothetical protein n=1 Tax=Vulcanococcus limneticus TaxID=2170428 RepID=UPI00398C1A1D
MHGRDSRAEIEAAHCCTEACGYGVLTADAPWIRREGVLGHQATDLLLITLRMCESKQAPTHSGLRIEATSHGEAAQAECSRVLHIHPCRSAT